MQFDVYAIGLSNPIATEDTVDIAELVGRTVEFNSPRLAFKLLLPSSVEGFAALDALAALKGRMLCSLTAYSRVFRRNRPDGFDVSVLATAERAGGGLDYYVLDFDQPRGSQKYLLEAARLHRASVMTFEECAVWLEELYRRWDSHRDQAIMRSIPAPLPTERVGFVGPSMLGDVYLPCRLEAIGAVHGVNVSHVPHGGFVPVRKGLLEVMPLDGVFVCRNLRPAITLEAMPVGLDPNSVELNAATDPEHILGEFTTWIREILKPQVAERRLACGADAPGERTNLMCLMLSGMLSHNKIGQWSHCTVDNVLKGVRARGLNARLAAKILDENTELFCDRPSGMFFLWKEHGAARLYFLNPQKVATIKAFLRENGFPTPD